MEAPSVHEHSEPPLGCLNISPQLDRSKSEIEQAGVIPSGLAKAREAALVTSEPAEETFDGVMLLGGWFVILAWLLAVRVAMIGVKFVLVATYWVS